MAASYKGIALVVVLLAAIAVASLVWLGRSPPDVAQNAPSGIRTLVTTLRSEPATFNRYASAGRAYPTLLVTCLSQASLVRINRITDELEPWLAESWVAADEGLRYDVTLRQGVRFSDGTPFTADDVAFSFAALYDPRVGSPLAQGLRVAGRPLTVDVHSDTQLSIRFPAPYGPGLRVLDGIPIYPRHRLEPFLTEGTMGDAWGPTTPPADIVGLGPFRLEHYEPGQRLVFARNPYYWRTDDDGQPLPRLDRIVVELVPDQNAELLRLQAGQIDLMQGELRPEDFAPLKAAADQGRLRMIDVGTSLDTYLLWFNLTPPREDRRTWWRDARFRRAVSHAVDRDQFADTVFLGAAEPAWHLVSPANTAWHASELPPPAFDRDRARELLAAMGFSDRNGDGMLQDASGAPIRFTVLVQKGITAAEKGAAFLRDELAQVGVGVDVAALELGAVISRWSSGDYDAIYHMMQATDTDPAGNLDLWLSSGSAHLWHPNQVQPATDWERQMDALVQKIVSVVDPAERRALFVDVQRIVAAQNPVLVFAVPHVYVATSLRVGEFTPAVSRPQILWNPDVVSVRP